MGGGCSSSPGQRIVTGGVGEEGRQRGYIRGGVEVTDKAEAPPSTEQQQPARSVQRVLANPGGLPPLLPLIQNHEVFRQF